MVLLAVTTVNVWFLVGAIALVLIVYFNGLTNQAHLKAILTEKERVLNEKEIHVVKQEGIIKEKDLVAAGLIKEKGLTIGKLQSDIQVQAQKIAEGQFTTWKEKELEAHRKVIIQAAIERAQAMLAEWKISEGEKLRKDAVKRSMGVNFGKITEHLIPFSIHLQDFDPRDIRFIGSPVDLMIFDGATEKADVIDIYFVEIKTGSGVLSKKQKTIRDAIEAPTPRVHWMPIIVPEFKWDVPDEEDKNIDSSPPY
jgi:predicted Holliday junction resolvase-like endonuclease